MSGEGCTKRFHETLYACECGFETLHDKHMHQHAHTKKCCGKSVTKTPIVLVREDECDRHQAQAQMNIGGDAANNTIIAAGARSNVVQTVVNIHYHFPDATLEEDMLYKDRSEGREVSHSARDLIRFPATVLRAARDPAKHPGAITARGDKIVEKLPAGGATT